MFKNVCFFSISLNIFRFLIDIQDISIYNKLKEVSFKETYFNCKPEVEKYLRRLIILISTKYAICATRSYATRYYAIDK